MKQQIARLREQIKDRGWQAVWISSESNRRYLSGFTGSSGWIVVSAEGQVWLLTDGRYAQQARQETTDLKVIICQRDPLGSLAELLSRHKIKRLGFEDDQISVAVWRRLKRLLPRTRGYSCAGWIEKQRAIKTPYEIRMIKRALYIAEKAVSAFKRKIAPGRSERELALSLEQALYTAGAEGLAFPLIVAAGPNSALPHATPTTRKIKSGDLLVLDFGACFKGYHSDLTRTFAIRKSTEKQREIYNLVKNAQKTSKKSIISGQKASESDKNARRIFHKAKVEKNFVHGLGHGLGLEIHEMPRLSSFSQDVLETNMVVTCEPGLYFPKWGGIRIEDDVLVRRKESLWLSQSPEELQIIGKG